VRAVHDALMTEAARRNAHRDSDAHQDPIESIPPSLGPAEASEAYENLRRDVTDLEYVASLAGETEARELRQAAEFLYKVAEACLPPGKRAESGLVQ
jgi:hypothetical protein